MWCCHLPDSCRHNQVLAREPFNKEQTWGNIIDFRTLNKIQRGVCYCNQEGDLRSLREMSAYCWEAQISLRWLNILLASMYNAMCLWLLPILLSKDQQAPLWTVRCLHHALKDTRQLLLITVWVQEECPDSTNYSQQHFGNHQLWDFILLYQYMLVSKKPTDVPESSVMCEQHTALPGQRSLNLISKNIPSRLY